MNPKLVELAFVPEVHVETNDAPKSDFLCHRWYVNRWSKTIAVQAAPRQRPCAEIRAACEQAGFVQGGSQTGDGLFVDCDCAHLKGTPPTTQGHQAFARDRFAACCSLQSAESKFRPAERFPVPRAICQPGPSGRARASRAGATTQCAAIASERASSAGDLAPARDAGATSE